MNQPTDKGAQMSDELQNVLWAISFRIGQLRERHRGLNTLEHYLTGDPKTRDRIEGNLGALEQVQRWLTGTEEMPRMDMSLDKLQDMEATQ